MPIINALSAGAPTRRLGGIGGGSKFIADPGDQLFTTAGAYTWTVPDGVYSVSVVTVGAGGYGGGATDAFSGSWRKWGGGGGGGLSYLNDIEVSPGQEIPIQVGQGNSTSFRWSYFQGYSTVYAGNGAQNAVGRTTFPYSLTFAREQAARAGGQGGVGLGQSQGGGAGGGGGVSSPPSQGNEDGGGGGGAGGYSGNGGNGGGGTGSGGGGGGGGTAAYAGGGGGGGVGLYGEGPSGSGGANLINPPGAGGGGQGGSSGAGGNSGVSTNNFEGIQIRGGYGGNYGGGGGQGSDNRSRIPTIANGGAGAVRIIWGDGRNFPNNAAAV